MRETRRGPGGGAAKERVSVGRLRPRENLLHGLLELLLRGEHEDVEALLDGVREGLERAVRLRRREHRVDRARLAPPLHQNIISCLFFALAFAQNSW